MIKIELQGSTGTLTGVPFDTFQELYGICGYKVNGAEHSDLFIEHRWDGYKRMLTKKGKFGIGMLSRIENFLISKNLKYKIKNSDNQPTTVQIDVGLNVDEVELRDYQQEAVQSALDNKIGIIQVATGGGKTTIASGLIAEVGQRTFFMVHTKDLMYQAKHEFERMLGQEIGQMGDGVIDLKPITVATMQTLSMFAGFKYVKSADDSDQTEKVINKGKIQEHKKEVLKAIDECRLLIWDEVHRIACDTAISVSNVMVNALYRIGLSASPWRDDGADLEIESAMGQKIYVLSATDLIEKGHLVRPIIKIDRMPSFASMEESANRKLNYHDVYRVDIVENRLRNQKIVDYYVDFTSRGIQTMILVKQIKHGNVLKKMISTQYDPIEFLSGRDASTKRLDTIESLRAGERMGIIASTIADEGLDIRRLGAIILAGGGKSSTRALQRVGRAIRPFKDKDYAYIIDFNDEHKYLKKHTMARKAMYKTEPGFIIIEL